MDLSGWCKAASVLVLALVVTGVVPSTCMSFEVSEEVEVTGPGDGEARPRAAFDSSGHLHVIYINTTGDWSLMWRKLDEEGRTVSGPREVTPDEITGTIGSLAMAVDATDRIHIAFSATAGDDEVNQVYYTVLSATGSVLVPPKHAFGTGVAEGDADIDTDAGGNAYIVGIKYMGQTTSNVLEWSKWSASGHRELYTEMQTTGVGRQIDGPRIGVDATGASYIVHRSRDNYIDRYGLVFQTIDRYGDPDIFQGGIAGSTLYDVTSHQVDIDPARVMHMAYVMNNRLHLVHIDPDGSTGIDTEIDSAPLGAILEPDIAATAGGDSWVVCSRRDNQLPSTSTHISASHYWEEEDYYTGETQSITDDSTDQASVAARGDGAVIVFRRIADLYFVSLSDTVPTNNPPTASLSAYPSGAKTDDVVTLDGSASSDPDEGDGVESWYFEFGDGISTGWMDLATATHIYSTAGTYTARLRVMDTHGAESGTAEVVVTITSTSTTNQVPTARLSANPVSVNVGSEVLFDGTSSSDPDGTVEQYLFSFGDGDTLGWTTTSQATHTYDSAGVYTASLQVKDDKGKASTNKAEVTVTVEQPNEAPVAEIVSIEPNPAMVGDTITFTGRGTDPDGVITQYAWDSNMQPTLSDQATFQTTSMEIGIHTVSLKVRDDDGVWSEPATMTLEVKQNNPPTLVVLTDRTEAKAGTEVEFKVRYIDPEGDAPTSARLYYGTQTPYFTEALLQVDETDTNYKDGKEYHFKAKLGEPGNYTYYFEFVNAKNPKQLSEARHILVKEDGGFLPGASVAATVGAMLVAVAIVLVSPRRRRPSRG